MDLFRPVLLQVREWLKPLANMKNAMSFNQIVTGLMGRTGLPAALRRSVQGWGLGILGIILGAALVLSLLARARRDEWSVKSCWQGKSLWLAALLALLFGAVGAHRFYLRRHVTGAVQAAGLLPFLSGAFLLGEARMMDFVVLSDNVVGGIILFAAGLIFDVWRLLDLFMILFGGLTPRKKKPRK